MTYKGVSPTGAPHPTPTTTPPFTPRFTGCPPYGSGNPRPREGKAPRPGRSRTLPSTAGLWLPSAGKAENEGISGCHASLKAQILEMTGDQ